MPNSLVKSDTINSNFPVAGQNNDSQGFRDNFLAIKVALARTAVELTELRDHSVLKGPFPGMSVDNDMNNSVIYRPQLRSYSETYYDNGSAGLSLSISFLNGNFQKLTTTNDLVLGLSDFPGDNSVGRLVLWVVCTDRNHEITLPAQVSLGNQALFVEDGKIKFPDVGNYLIEFIGLDSGNRFYLVSVAGLNEFSGNVTTNGINNMAGGLPIASPSQFGVVKVDGTTIAITEGVISVVGGTVLPSDVRLKHNITTIVDPLTKVSQLRGVDYNLIANNEKSMGLIAQELLQVLPELVKTMPNGYLGVEYANLTALLIECVKELNNKIHALENRIVELEQR